MAHGNLSRVFAALLIYGLQQVLRGAALIPTVELQGGLGPYLAKDTKYSLFNKIVQKLNESTSYSDSTTGWFEGPTNQTLLVVSDNNLRKGFVQLAEQYKISNPDTFVDRLIDIADGSTGPPTGSSPTFSKANWAAIALLAFAGSHTLPSVNFYANHTILGAPYQTPINLTTSVTGYYPYTGNLQAYDANNAPGPSTVYLRQEGGLQHAQDGLAVPHSFLRAVHTNGYSEFNKLYQETTVYLYELNGIFLYGQTFGPADVTGYSGNAALKYFAENGI